MKLCNARRSHPQSPPMAPDLKAPLGESVVDAERISRLMKCIWPILAVLVTMRSRSGRGSVNPCSTSHMIQAVRWARHSGLPLLSWMPNDVAPPVQISQIGDTRRMTSSACKRFRLAVSNYSLQFHMCDHATSRRQQVVCDANNPEAVHTKCQTDSRNIT